MSGCCLASLFCPVRCSSHVVFVQIFPTAYRDAGYFYQIIWHFPVVRAEEGGRACCGGDPIKGSHSLVFWHVHLQ